MKYKISLGDKLTRIGSLIILCILISRGYDICNLDSNFDDFS